MGEKVKIIIASVQEFKQNIPDLLSQIAPCYAAKYEKHKRMQDKLQEVVSGYLLRQYLGVVRDEQLTYNEYNKPMLASKEKYFNLSHSRDYVVLGIADCELGVDVERLRKCHEATVKKVFRPEHQTELSVLTGNFKDQKFTEIWTMYESVLKLRGIGFSHGWGNIPVESYYVKSIIEGEYYISCATEEPVQVEVERAETEYRYI